MATTFDPETADLGTIESVPSARLVIDPNVRKDIRLDKSFISSIRVRGFEQYPVGWRDGDLVHITVGQRRVSAALEIGWARIPVVVKDQASAEGDRAEELRLLAQLAENDQRAPLSASERAGAYKQLALFGITEDQIARKTNTPRQHVETALKVVASKIALDEMAKHELTLDQAAALVEFENDKKALAELRDVAKTRPEQLEHVVQQQRSRVKRERHGQSIADQARLEGWEPIIRSHGDDLGYGMPSGVKALRDLARADDTTRKALTVEDVKDLEGRVVIIDPRYRGEEAEVTWALRNPAKHGFADRYGSTGGGKGPLTDEEKAARKQKRLDKQEMTDATVVRRQWIAEVLARPAQKRPDAAAWIAQTFLGTDVGLSYYQRDDRARDLLLEWLGSGASDDKYSNGRLSRHALGTYLTEHPDDASRVALAYSIALAEDPAGDPKHASFGQFTELAPYLLQLQAWGYTLADVEQRIVAAAKKAKGRK